jgi:hypothetical protein
MKFVTLNIKKMTAREGNAQENIRFLERGTNNRAEKIT